MAWSESGNKMEIDKQRAVGRIHKWDLITNTQRIARRKFSKHRSRERQRARGTDHRMPGLRGLLLVSQRARGILCHAQSVQIVVGKIHNAVGLAHVGAALEIRERLAIGRVGAAAVGRLGVGFIGLDLK